MDVIWLKSEPPDNMTEEDTCEFDEVDEGLMLDLRKFFI